MKKLKVLAAAALTAVSIGAHAVAAGPGDLGPILDVPILIGNVVRPGLLFDVYSFDVQGDTNGLSGVAVALNTPPIHALPDFLIAPFEVRLQDSTFKVIGTDNNPADGFSFVNLARGSYALTFVGLAAGGLGGAYAGALVGQIATVTPPVPEPGSFALMLAGLAAVGFVVARRRSRG